MFMWFPVWNRMSEWVRQKWSNRRAHSDIILGCIQYYYPKVWFLCLVLSFCSNFNSPSSCTKEYLSFRKYKAEDGPHRVNSSMEIRFTIYKIHNLPYFSKDFVRKCGILTVKFSNENKPVVYFWQQSASGLSLNRTDSDTLRKLANLEHYFIYFFGPLPCLMSCLPQIFAQMSFVYLCWDQTHGFVVLGKYFTATLHP